MKASIFLTLNPDSSLFHRATYMTEEADSAEECLRKLQDRLSQKIGSVSLTFRPIDGMIFCWEISSDIPIGVLYREGYQPNK